MPSSNTPIGDAITKIGSEQGLDVAVTQGKDRPTGVQAVGAVNVGKGWSFGGAVQYAKDSWAWAVGASWRPKAK